MKTPKNVLKELLCKVDRHVQYRHFLIAMS